MTDIPANKRCLLIQVSSGLGNRLRAMLSAVHVAKQAERTPVVFWVPKKNCKAEFRHLFGADTAAWLNVFNRDPHNEEWDIGLRGQYCTPELISGAAPRVLVRTNNIIGSKQIAWPQLFSVFDLNEDVATKANRKMAEMEHGLLGHLGIHVRRGDHKAACAVPIEDYFAIADDWDGPLYLASDSSAVRTAFYSRYGAQVDMLDIRSFKRYKYDGIQDAFVDMLLLSRCASVCGLASSSFGRMAARIGGSAFIDVGATVEA